MKVNMSWVAADTVAEISYEDAVINTLTAFEAWKRTLLQGFERLLAEAGGRFPLIVDVTNLRITKQFSHRYSDELAAVVAKKYASAIARYGPPGQTTSVIAVEAMRRALLSEDPLALERRYGANLFESRAAALEFVHAISEAKAAVS